MICVSCPHPLCLAFLIILINALSGQYIPLGNTDTTFFSHKNILSLNFFWLLFTGHDREGKKITGDFQIKIYGDFPGGTVVKNLPANEADMGSNPDPVRSHMPRSN